MTRRGASPLPKVEELPEESETKEVTQALINERCYELTVSPLADVTEAYVEKSTEATASPATPKKTESTFTTIRVRRPPLPLPRITLTSCSGKIS